MKSHTLVIYKEPYRIRYFLIPDSKITKEQRELFKFASSIQDPEYIGFTDPEVVFTEEEFKNLDQDKKKKLRCWTIIQEKDKCKKSKTKEEADQLSDKYIAASELIDPDEKGKEGFFFEYETNIEDIKNYLISHLYSWQYII